MFKTGVRDAGCSVLQTANRIPHTGYPLTVVPLPRYFYICLNSNSSHHGNLIL
jgi:hypothetical protein